MGSLSSSHVSTRFYFNLLVLRLAMQELQRTQLLKYFDILADKVEFHRMETRRVKRSISWLSVCLKKYDSGEIAEATRMWFNTFSIYFYL